MDLAWRQVDLATEWRSRRWRKLLNLIDNLPRNTHYAEALSQDEDVARAWLDIPEQDRPEAAERLHEWSPERATLASIHDRLAELVAVTINVNSRGGGRKPLYAERPEGAVKRLEEELAVARVHAAMGDWMN